MMTLENEIIQLLQNDEFTVSQIAERLKKKLESISRTLSVMEKKGLITKQNYNVTGTTVQKKMISLNKERVNELTQKLNDITSKPLNDHLTKPKDVKLLSPSKVDIQKYVFEIDYPIRDNKGVIVSSEKRKVTQNDAIEIINELQNDEFLNHGKIYEKDQRINELTKQLNDLTNQLTNVKLLSPSCSPDILNAWQLIYKSNKDRYKNSRSNGMLFVLNQINNFFKTK